MSTAFSDFAGYGFDIPPLALRRFSVDEFQPTTEAGVLTEDDPVELLEDLIVEKVPKTPCLDAAIDLHDLLHGSSHARHSSTPA